MKQKYFKYYIRKKVRNFYINTGISNEISFSVRFKYKLAILSEYLMQR